MSVPNGHLSGLSWGLGGFQFSPESLSCAALGLSHTYRLWVSQDLGSSNPELGGLPFLLSPDQYSHSSSHPPPASGSQRPFASDLVSREFDLHRKPIRKIQSLQKLHLHVIKRNLGLNYVDNCLHSPLHFACRYLPSEGYFEDK